MITYVIESHTAAGNPIKMHQSDLLASCERSFRGTAFDINLRWESFDGVDELIDIRFSLALHSAWQWMLAQAEEHKNEPDYNDLLQFSEEHCRNCGTQRCLGVFDEEWREGCTEYKRKFK